MEAYKQEFIEFMVESDVLKFGDFLKTLQYVYCEFHNRSSFAQTRDCLLSNPFPDTLSDKNTEKEAVKNNSLFLHSPFYNVRSETMSSVRVPCLNQILPMVLNCFAA